jgi:serine/threonine-protein kinase
MEDASQEEVGVVKHNSSSGPKGYVLAIDQYAPGTQYMVVQWLGQGGMGTVYAVVKAPGIKGAMKVLHPKWAARPVFCQRFVQEVALHARLEAHDNLVKVKDCGLLADGTPFVVMELLEGRTLHYLMRMHRKNCDRPIEPGRTYEIAKQFCEGLSWLHMQQPAIVHRDFKPENVFVCQRVGTGRDATNRVKILDFGIAKVLDGSRDDGELVGTPNYMAPEQIAPGGGVTGATDTYAAALVIYEMLTGRRPFRLPADASDKQVLEAQAYAKPIEPSVFAPWLPSKVDEVILRALDKNPQVRPPDPNALIDELKMLEFAQIDQPVQGNVNVNNTSPDVNTMVGWASRPKEDDEHDTYQGFSLPPVEGPTLELALEGLVDQPAPLAPVAPQERGPAPVAAPPLPIEPPSPVATPAQRSRPKATPTLEVPPSSAWPQPVGPPIVPSVVHNVVPFVDPHADARAMVASQGAGAPFHPPHSERAAAPPPGYYVPVGSPARAPDDPAEALFFSASSQGGTSLSLPNERVSSVSRPPRSKRRPVVQHVFIALSSGVAVVMAMVLVVRLIARPHSPPAAAAGSSVAVPVAQQPRPEVSAESTAAEPLPPLASIGSVPAAPTPTAIPSASTTTSAHPPVAPHPSLPRAAPAAKPAPTPSDGRDLLRTIDGDDPFRSKLKDLKPATHP